MTGLKTMTTMVLKNGKGRLVDGSPYQNDLGSLYSKAIFKQTFNR